MTLVAAFKILLARYSGQEDVILGTATAGRRIKKLESLMGFFVNTLALRSNLSNHLSFEEFLTQIKQVCLDAYAHQDVPFEQLVEVLQPERNLSHSPIFQVMFVLQNTAMEELELPGLTVSSLETSRKTSKFDLTLSMEENDEKLRGEWEYNTDLFHCSTIERMTTHFQVLLSEILTNPQENIWELPLLTQGEKQQLLVEWNQTKLPLTENLCLHQVFEEQVEKIPEAIALIFGEEEISYQQLNQKANQLAHYLRSLGVQTETLIGLFIERSPIMIIAMLAILKVGATYVPLDTKYPQERLSLILEDCQISLLLTQTSLEKILDEENYNINQVNIDNLSLDDYSDYNIKNRVKSHNLAYIIYTSGSTGKPKGVAIEHRSPVALVYWAKERFSPQEFSGVLASTSICFDLSIFEIFVTLGFGGSIIMMENALELPESLHRDKVTLINTVPSIISELIKVNSIPQSVKIVTLAGEPLTVNIVHQLYKIDTIEKVYNLYGPSEDTTYSTCELISKEITDNPSIGRPITNTKIYILDKHFNPVPCGVSGELYIGGDGLARGYFNRPELTKQKFIDSPFEHGQKLYRTGDLASYRKDGKIDFLGRIDNQVKIRGFRIELGEIEAVLNNYVYIKEAKVTSKKDKQGCQQLVAYIILDNKQILCQKISQEIREYLQHKLPAYMIPYVFVPLEYFPLTPNGKINYSAFPEPDVSTFQSNYIAPRTPTEEIIANIWVQVLDIKNVGINDNFFEVGGHSLLGTQIISRIRDSLNIEIPLKLFFDFPTIAKLAEHIESRKSLNISGLSPIIEPRKKQKQLPLSFAQERLWFLTKLEPKRTDYNMPFILEIKGLLNIVALEKSINTIIERHEILRTNFSSIDGKPTQIINKDINFKLSIDDLRNKKETQANKIVNQFTERPFDLAKGLLFSVKLLQLDTKVYWLIFNIHHIIFDGWSYEILQKELFTLYQAYGQEKIPELGQIPIQYADFSLWQRHWFTEQNLASQLNYWKEQLKGTLPILQLPTDFPRPSLQTYQADSYSWHLSSELTTKIKSFCQQAGVTLFMTFLTVFKLLLSRYTAEKDVIVGTPIASRNRTEIENLIGFFINTVALRTNLAGNPSFQELLSRVRQVTLDGYSHQDLPFEKLVQELKPERNLSYNPIFQVWFNMINLPRKRVKCDGLQFKSIPVFDTMAKFDISFYLEEENQEIKLKFVYNKLLFKSSTIEGMSRHFQTLLEQVIIAPENNIASFSLLSEKECYQLTHQVNKVTPTNSFLNFPKTDIEQSIPSRFEEQVKKYPDKIAVQSKDNQYTYQKLNTEANKIAKSLLNLGIDKQAKVALFFDHNVSMIAAMLGVLKAGKIYVPIDPNYPQDRVLYTLEDSCAEVILTNQINSDNIKAITHGKLPIINIDKLNDVAVEINLEISPDTLAYILYTSGSTGQPKGVIQNHLNVLHFIRNHTNNLHISADDNLNLLASYSFDAAVIDIFSALLNGATLFVFDIKKEGLNSLYNWLETHKITIFHSTPTVYRYFLEKLGSKVSLAKAQLSHIRLVVLGGEPVLKKDVKLYQQFFADNCIFVNGLGATECSFYLQYLLNKKTQIQKQIIPVGSTFEDTEIVLLDEEGNITDLYGEIAVRSPHVALGYWQKEELTQAVFLKDFQGKDKRIYSTGDWGRLRNDGVIECLGRKDNQVKIRGFRVELGEIEALLNKHPQIKQSVVIYKEDSLREKQLIAYIVPQDISLVSNSQPQIIKQVREFLQEKLPSYMIPAKFVLLETLPLTPNGKIDRRILTAREESEVVVKESFIPPRSPLEEQISNIWQKMLGIELIGVNDNFFDLGGHSLLAIRLLARIEKEFKVNISLYTFLNNPTISSLVNLIQGSEDRITESSVVPIQTQGNKLPLFFVNSISYAQKFASYLDKDQPFYILNIFGITDFLTPKIKQLKLEDIATKFIEDMESIAPNIPYYLITYCGDLSLTIEMVRQLEKKGVEIPCIFLIDAFWKPEDWGFHLHWYNLGQFGISYLVEKIKNNLFVRREKLIIFVNLMLGKLSFSDEKNSSRYMKDINLLKALMFARNKYSPQPSQVKVVLFLSQEYRLLNTSKLNEFLTAGIEVEEIPGYHHTLFQEPYIQKLTQKLQDYLDNNPH